MALIHQYVRSAPMSRIPRRLPPQPQENGLHARTSSAPSKLEKLQADFQRRMLQEKSEKMVSLYEQNRNRALAKVQKDMSNRNGSVREFFKQRRTNNYLDQNGWNNASQASSGQSTPTGYAAKPPIYKQRDHSGRDRSKPLAPIEPRTPPDHSRTYKVTNGVPMHSPKPPLPRNEKQSYVRPQIKGVIKNNTNDHSPSGQRGKPNQRKHFRSESEGSAGKVQGWQKWQEQQRLAREKKTRRKQSITDNEESDDGSSQKLSDFQKWQLQQNKEREARLKNHKTNNRNYQDENENYIMDSNRSNKSNKKPPPVDKRIFLQMRNRQGSFEQFSDGDNEEDDDDDESSPPSRPLSQREQVLEADIIARKEAEMMAMLDKKRRELESIQAVTKEEEKREAERKKREKAQEQRMRKIREAEEAQKRLQEEEEEREEAERRKREEEEEEERRRVEEKKRKLKLKAKTPIKQRVKPRESPPQEDEYKIDNTQSVAFYANIVDEEGGNVQLQLKPCSVCGRKFAAERLQKHMKACSQSSKKTRKVFDPMKMRVKGTDHEQFAVHAVKNPTPEKKKTSAWRKKHEEFQNAIKYAKKVTAVEAAGGNVAALPPPPRSENADYKQCPYCQRKFNEGAAERHIPWCKEKSQKSRPSPIKKNTRNKYR